ncbi:hypothetical protein DB346_19575 [Verrucomicrobia bacterium LW23]|nr:hypothetical protein DB346_19575 [Verrucomicrobia bacterium LW23]
MPQMNPSTRILHLIHHDDRGGAPVAMVHQLRYLAAPAPGGGGQPRCLNMAVFGRGGGAGQGPGRIEAFCRQHNVPFATPWLGSKLLLPAALLHTWWIIRRWRPDMVLLYGQWGAPVGALAARMAGVRRCVYNAQWPAYYQDFSPLKAAANNLAEAVPAALCRRVIALSPGNFHQYFIRGWDEPATAGGAPRLVQLPNCTDTAAPSPESVAQWRAQWGWRPDTVQVVSLGRLVPQKRMDWLMRAWALWQSQPHGRQGAAADGKDAAPAAHLWIVGGGDVQRFRALARELGIASTCTLTGFESDGWKRLAAADIFALTSRSEGLPFVVIEAMAAGVPVLASRVDGIEGTVREGIDGLLAPATDLHAFAHALDRLVRDADLRRRLGQGGRERSKDFDCATVLPRYEALYNEVLAEQ